MTQPTRTRRMDAPLGPGECCDRLLAIERDMAPAAEQATRELCERFFAKQRALLARVPEDLRVHCIGMVASQNPELAERLAGGD